MDFVAERSQAPADHGLALHADVLGGSAATWRTKIDALDAAPLSALVGESPFQRTGVKGFGSRGQCCGAISAMAQSVFAALTLAALAAATTRR